MAETGRTPSNSAQATAAHADKVESTGEECLEESETKSTVGPAQEEGKQSRKEDLLRVGNYAKR